MSINVMLVDDEPHIRMILRKVIERQPEFKVVGECDNMADALIIFNQYRPEVVFMDIEIEGSSGVDCARVISKLAPKTKIIFATAHSEYMSNAFELYAFDYLVKPFDIERIQHTLQRIVLEQKDMQELLKTTDTMDQNKEMNQIDLNHVSENESGKDTDRARLIIKGKENVNFVDVKDIILVERENNTTVLYTKSGEIIKTSMSMGEIENRLNSKQFMRSHKSYIINISMIKSVEPYGRWTYIVKFKGTDQDALVTKEKYELLRQMFE